MARLIDVDKRIAEIKKLYLQRCKGWKKVLEMAEYIERNEIRKTYEKLTRSYVNGDSYIAGWRLDEMIESLPAADVEPVQEWISVDDELPVVGGYVVCIAKRNPFSRFMPMVARIEKNGWVNPMTEQYISEVIHWMPMPELPKGE